MSATTTPPDLTKLLMLERVGDNAFRCPRGEQNPNGRVYGGQLMGQAVAAAMHTLDDAERPATSLQLTFLAGTRPDEPIDFAVSRLQDGKRVSTRHIEAVQSGRPVMSATVSFHAPSPGDASEGHETAGDAWLDTLATAAPLVDMPAEGSERLLRSGFRGFVPHEHIETRFVAPERFFSPEAAGGPNLMWMRIGPGTPLSRARAVHEVALAYMSDWWQTFVSLSFRLKNLQAGGGHLYVASLNHNLWLHAPCFVDEWLLHVTASPWANGARGLSIGRIYRADGRLVASTAQEVLQVRRDAPRGGSAAGAG
jgi:acyl-CoA thioesterase-2